MRSNAKTARLLAAALGAVVLTAPAQSDISNTNSARDWASDSTVLFAAAPAAGRAVERRRPVRGSYGPDPAIFALVQRAADEAGIPRDVMNYHVKRESGFRPDARNPKSTATGLLQVVKGSHEAIIGRKLTLSEHVSLMRQPAYALRVGAAHMRACADLTKNLYACHYHGHARFGGRIEMAARYFKPDSNGWLDRGSVAMPWAGDRTTGGA